MHGTNDGIKERNSVKNLGILCSERMHYVILLEYIYSSLIRLANHTFKEILELLDILFQLSAYVHVIQHFTITLCCFQSLH